jgi:hypothetical protein
MTLPTYNPDEIMDALQRADYEFVLENAMSHAVAGNSGIVTPNAQSLCCTRVDSEFGEIC